MMITNSNSTSPSLEPVHTLDVYVDRALQFFARQGDYQLALPSVESGKLTLVTGSQNGYWTGVQMALSAGLPFVPVKEAAAQQAIDTAQAALGRVMIVSATGSRQVVPIAEYALKKGLEVDLVVCKADSQVTRTCGSNPHFNEILVPGMEHAPYEAPTINTATYGRMLQGVTHEDPAAIMRILRGRPFTLENGQPVEFANFDALVMVFADRMDAVAQMVDWKLGGEIIGRQTGSKACYLTNLMHGAFVVDGPKELYVAVGLPGKERAVFADVLKDVPPERKLCVDLPLDSGPLTAMMTGYAIVGEFQKKFPAFQERINAYAEKSRQWDWLSPINDVTLD